MKTVISTKKKSNTYIFNVLFYGLLITTFLGYKIDKFYNLKAWFVWFLPVLVIIVNLYQLTKTTSNGK